jgi:uncharacterized protein DUF4349
VEGKSARSLFIISPDRRVRRGGSALLASLFFLLLTVPLSAQEDDPSEIFLKAYLSAQQGEKMEHESQFKAALAKFRFAGSLIEELRISHPDWQPPVVEYRGRKIGEGILRVQQRIWRQNELASGPSRLPDVVPSLPENETWSEPGPEVVAPQGLDTISQGSSDAAIEEATGKLRRKVDQLQAALEKSRGDVETARKEKEAVNTRLQEASSKLENVQNEIETSTESEHQARDELAQSQASLKMLEVLQENTTTEQQQLHAQIADLKNAVAVAEEARAIAEKQMDDTDARLTEANKQLVTLEQERDEALAQLKGVRETEQRVQAILAEKDDLQQELVNAEKLVLAELDKLKIKSDALNEQLEFLAQPVTSPSGEEIPLLPQPLTSSSDQNFGVFQSDFVSETKSPVVVPAKSNGIAKPAHEHRLHERILQRSGFITSIVGLMRSRAVQFSAVGAILVALVQVGRMVTENTAASRRRKRYAEERAAAQPAERPESQQAPASGLDSLGGLTARRSQGLTLREPAPPLAPLASGTNPAEAPLHANGKRSRNGNGELEKVSFDDAVQKIAAFANEEHGYVATTNSEEPANGELCGQVVVKVLPENLDGFLEKVRGLGELSRQTLGAEKVIETYSDTDAWLRTGRVMEQGLIDMLKGDKVELNIAISLNSLGRVENVSVQCQDASSRAVIDM